MYKSNEQKYSSFVNKTYLLEEYEEKSFFIFKFIISF